MEDLLAGVPASGQGLDTELDIARLASRKTSQDLRRVAYEEYVQDLKKVLGDSPDVEKALRKGQEFFTNDEATSEFINLTDKLTNTWRKMATIWNVPMFTARNGISNQYMKFTEGLLDPDASARVVSLLSGQADSISVGGVEYTKDAFVNLAQRNKVIQDIGDVAGVVGPQLGKKQSLFTRSASAVNQFVESTDRLAAFVTAMERKGLDPKAAGALVDKTMLDYAPEALTAFERNVMRRVVPFYTFSRRNTPHMLELLATKPGVLTPIGHAKQSGEAVTGIDSQQMPDYLQNLFGIPLPNGQVLSTGGILPIQDIERIVPQNPREYAREQLTAANPLLRDPLEFLFNKDLYRDTDIESFKGELRAAPDYVTLFDAAVKKVPGASSVWEQVKSSLGMAYKEQSDGTQYLAMNPAAAKALKDLLPFMSGVARGFGDDDARRFSQLTGIKLVPADTQDWQQQQVYADQRTLQDALSALKERGVVVPKAPKKSAQPKTLQQLLKGGR
jgi:hypothetical protein